MSPYKVFHLEDDIYQVVEFNPDVDEYDCPVHQGSLSDCEAYINLKIGRML